MERGTGIYHLCVLSTPRVCVTADIPSALGGVSRELVEALGHLVPSHLSEFAGETEKI